MSNGPEVEKFKRAFAQITEYSLQLKPYRDRDRGLSRPARDMFGTSIDEVFDELQGCYERDAFDETGPLFEQLGKLLTKAEEHAGTPGEYSKKLKPFRDRAREIPTHLVGPIDDVFNELQDCYQKEDFEEASPLFDKLQEAIEQAEQNWYKPLREEIDRLLPGACDGAPEELQQRADTLNEANKQLAKTDLCEAAIDAERLVEYLEFVAKEKVRIEAARREEEERERRERELERARKVLRNAETLAEDIQYYDKCATIAEQVEPELGKTIRAIHAELVKYQDEHPEIEDVNELEQQMSEITGDLDLDVVTLIENLRDVYPKIQDVYDPDSTSKEQVELGKTYGDIIQLITEEKFGEANQRLEQDVPGQLRALEGEALYERLLEQATEVYEAVDSDEDAWMPSEVKLAYDEAPSLAEAGEYGSAIGELRTVIAAKEKIDQLKVKWLSVKTAYVSCQSSKATSGQKKAAETTLDKAKKAASDSKFENASSELDNLLDYIQSVKDITDRRTDETRFPNVVGKAPSGGGMSSLESVKTKLKDGGMTAQDVMSLIPKDVVERWRVNPSEPDRFQAGFKYEWTKDGVQYHIHGHSKDHNHGEDTNSGSGAVVRIRIDDRWLCADGSTTTVIWKDSAHIPLF